MGKTSRLLSSLSVAGARRAPLLGLVALVSSVALAGACSANAPKNGFGGGGEGNSTNDGGGGAGVGGSGGEGGGLNLGGGGPAGSGGGPVECTPGGPDDDVDLDGYTPNTGDCNDCDKNANPNAVEAPTESGDPHDEDCDGQTDEVDPPCDDAMDIGEEDPLVVVKSVEICKASTGPGDWGLVSAEWVMADGSPPPPGNLVNFHLGHGVLGDFGPNVDVRRGQNMLALSSGSARRPNDPGYQNVGGFAKGYTCAHPQGFPKESPACPGSITGTPNDPTGIEVTLRTPSNAYGFAFDFDFYTYEWPDYVCSTYNDFFVAILAPIPMGQTDGNIVFDSQGNPVSVNNAFLEVCGCDGNPPSPCYAGGKTFTCALGNTELIGTGFGFDTTGYVDHGATSWLQTTAPVEPNSEMTIRWAVYDSGDGVLDTTTLVDNWRWIAKPGITVETSPIE